MRRLVLLLETVVVMFWNLENFFDPFKADGKDDGEFTPGGAKHWTWRQFERKRNGIAKIIMATQDSTGVLPAIVGLCEVENSMVVRQLVKSSPLAGTVPLSESKGAGERSFSSGITTNTGWGYVHRESPDARGIDVAMIYRRELFRVLTVDSLRIAEFPTRDILYVKGILKGIGDNSDRSSASDSGTGRSCRKECAGANGDTVHVIVNHWPSQLGGKKRTQERRDAAARLLKGLLDSLQKAEASPRIIVMGDFNSDKPEVPLHHPSTISNTPGTIKYKGRWEKIDHFFVSNSISNRCIEHIFIHPFLLEEDKAFLGVKPRRTFIGPRNNGGLSDHLPLLLVIE